MMPGFSPYTDDGFDVWRNRLASLPPTGLRVRRAKQTDRDAQIMRWIQAECEELFIQSVTENARQIANRLVFLAEVDDCPVGLCVSSVGRYNSEHLFIQRVGVVPPARRRGAGIALLSAAANEVPGMNIAGATAAGDEPAHALNRKLALRLSGNISNLRRGAFAPTDLGIVRGEPHIPWVIDRSPREVDGRSAR